MRRKNQNSKLPRIWHYVALGRVSALPWEMIKESESSYSVKKEKTNNTIKEINVLEDLKRWVILWQDLLGFFFLFNSGWMESTPEKVQD